MPNLPKANTELMVNASNEEEELKVPKTSPAPDTKSNDLFYKIKVP